MKDYFKNLVGLFEIPYGIIRNTYGINQVIKNDIITKYAFASLKLHQN